MSLQINRHAAGSSFEIKISVKLSAGLNTPACRFIREITGSSNSCSSSSHSRSNASSSTKYYLHSGKIDFSSSGDLSISLLSGKTAFSSS